MLYFRRAALGAFALLFLASVANAVERTPETAVGNLDVAEGLEATLFGSEPVMKSPSNIDIDHRGRVWVCDIMNYRRNKNKRPEGDRILILEDTDGDGKSDTSKVFYQGRDIDSALGICVLGNKVIVSCAPVVLVFTDTNGDDKADTKEVLFQSGQPQHDHSVHAFVFGPDGKLYFNHGNTGKFVNDKDGKPITDVYGNVVKDARQPYIGGMIFRCNPDGSEFETLAHNFRNNYEVAVDSFGTLWQSDNDDDGNKGVRINFVMEFGNYGYKDELTGAGWNSKRTGMHDEKGLRHWHLRDPGVVPNLLQTGGGSPCGIMVYEGGLLPSVFQNQMIHCDAGPSVCRAYPVKKSGAGYTAEIVNVLHGARDNWYRPSDVAAAPDGSIIVADWYDPGVGGHNQRDSDRGRLFRVAPPKSKYVSPEFDFKSADGAVQALTNPNLEARYLAWTSLHDMQAKAEPALLKLWKSENPVMRARALWLLGKIEGRGEHYVNLATKDVNEDIRITGIRLARQLKLDLPGLVKDMLNDKSPQVRRELLIALRHVESSDKAALWAALAAKHDGKDRWYLEALGISAHDDWDVCLEAWLDKVGGKWNTPEGRDIVWRSRAKATPALLAEILKDKNTTEEQRPRYFRAFDFHKGPEKDKALQSILGL